MKTIKGLYQISNLNETSGYMVIMTKKYAYVYNHKGFLEKVKHYAEDMRCIRNACSYIHSSYMNLSIIEYQNKVFNIIENLFE